MRKINILAVLKIISGIIGIILQSNDFKLSGTAILVLTILKYAYDSYMSFNAQDVANFANEQKISSKSLTPSGLITKTEVKQWSKK